MSQLLRLLGGLLFVALAVLTLVPAPGRFFWLAAIAATEWGYCLAIAALLPLVPGWRRSLAGRLGALLSLAAIVLLVMPVVRAMEVSRDLPDLFSAQFGAEQRRLNNFADDPRPAPLVLAQLVNPVRSRAVRYERRVFANLEGQEIAVDIYHPSYEHGPIPGVIVIPGGFWQGGDSTELVALNGYLAARD